MYKTQKMPVLFPRPKDFSAEGYSQRVFGIAVRKANRCYKPPVSYSKVHRLRLGADS
jgi:hypothetical protein